MHDSEWSSLRVRASTLEELREFCGRLKLTAEEREILDTDAVWVTQLCWDDRISLLMRRLEKEVNRKGAYRKPPKGPKPAA